MSAAGFAPFGLCQGKLSIKRSIKISKVRLGSQKEIEVTHEIGYYLKVF
jgi:hypothetical protein